MTVTQYIGARYVPLFSEPLEWDITKEYEPLTIVYNAGNSYTSRQAVPAGIDISNSDYWALTGNYNAQIEQYRKEVQTYDGRITANTEGIETEETRATTAENELATGIANEKTRATTAENELATGIANEKTRATTAENELATGIANEKTRAEEAERYLEQLTICNSVTPVYLGDFVAYNGKFFGTDETGSQPYGVQGYCYDGTYHNFALLNTGNTKAKIAVANEGANTWQINNKEYSNFAHANCMAYSESTGHYYVYTLSTNELVILNSNREQIKVLDTPTDTGIIAYDRATDIMWYICYNGDTYILENETSFKEQDIKLNTSFESTQVGQGGAVYNNVFVFIIGGDKEFYQQGLIAFDLNTGNFVKNIAIPNVNPIMGRYGELEDCDFDRDGNLYIASFKNNATDSDTTYCRVNYLWKTNFFTNRLEEIQFDAVDTSFCEGDSYTGFRSTGEKNYPFKDLAEWNLFVCQSPHPTRYTYFGYIDTSARIMKGFIFIDCIDRNITMQTAGTITYQGVISCRGCTRLNLRNDIRIKGAKNSPFTYLVRNTNSTIFARQIVGSKGDAGDTITNTVYMDGCVMLTAKSITLDGVANTPNYTNVSCGFGYVIGDFLKGSYS